MSGRYQAYPEYKESGVEWLGRVPAEWTISRVKYFAALNSSKSELNHLPRETEVTFLPMEAIGEQGELDTSRTKILSEVSTGYTYLAEGDVCIAKITPCFENGKGAIVNGLKNGIAFATTEVIPFRCSEVCDSGFLYHLLTSAPFNKQAEGSMYGAGGQKRVADSFVANYHFSIPPLREQTQIAAFLDHETAKIDRLIEKQQALIALLKEKRQAVISHAVTKGLNPSAPLKDSGIEWLGQVPAHWELGKTKYFAQLKTGHTPSRLRPEYWVDCNIPWFSLADVWQIRDERNIYLGDTSEKISAIGLANSAADLLPAGTVIVSRTASVGFSGIMPVPMATTQDFVNWIPGPKLESEYLLFVFRSMDQVFNQLKVGSTHKTIYMPDVLSFTTAIPPIEEQRAIVESLKRRLREFDKAAGSAEAMTTLLQERRTALISAAVTGKIDVRHWQHSCAQEN